jgi:hypothetical protein
MALHVTCHLWMTRMTTGERGDAETVTPRSEGGGRKRASNGTSSAPYPTWSIRSKFERRSWLRSFFSFVIYRSGEGNKVSCMSDSSIEFPTLLSVRMI